MSNKAVDVTVVEESRVECKSYKQTTMTADAQERELPKLINSMQHGLAALCDHAGARGVRFRGRLKGTWVSTRS